MNYVTMISIWQPWPSSFYGPSSSYVSYANQIHRRQMPRRLHRPEGHQVTAVPWGLTWLSWQPWRRPFSSSSCPSWLSSFSSSRPVCVSSRPFLPWLLPRPPLP